MFVALLMVMALAGGAAVTYFLMDAPRKRAVAELARAAAERRELEQDREQLGHEERALAAKNRELAESAAAHTRRTQKLAAKAAEFDRRVIGYDTLVSENARLKTDLRNSVFHFAHQEYRLGEAVAVAARRDELARAYLDEAGAAARRAVTTANYPATKEKLRSAFTRVREAGASVSSGDEDAALADLHRQYEKAVRAAVEREEQARLREQIRDEQRREREAKEAAERAEAERQAVAAALARALADTTNQHAAVVEALKAKLAEAEAKAARAKSNSQFTRTGYVYVISNIGSFGQDVFKIGMTRRSDPLVRVDELGDASVPFSFDVHMMIATADAPKLEAALHRAFHTRRVNRVNPRKEFFRVTINEIVSAVRENHGEVEYRADAEALEYLQSQSMSEADAKEVEAVFEAAERASVADGEED